MKSLAARIALLVFAIEIVVLAIFGLVARSIAQRELQHNFDASLSANAEALATLTELESDGSYEFEYAEKNMPRFHRENQPDIFTVLDHSDGIIAKSNMSDHIPILDTSSSEKHFDDFFFRQSEYRGVVLRSLPGDSERNEDAQQFITVFFATSREGLNAALARVTNRLILALFITGLLSGLLAAIVARKSLIPLRKFAGSLDTVTANNLNYRYNVETLPTDLRAPARAFNDLAERLREAFEKERRFSADAAHELRTPVAALKVAIQAAQRSERNDADDTAMLADLEKEAARLEDLCEQLLLLTASTQEPETGQSAPHWMEIVSDSVASLRDVAKSSGGTLHFRPDIKFDSSLSLQTSAATTHRIITNLINNAILHGGAGVNIAVSIEQNDDVVSLLVDDDGQGIAANDQNKVFERFFRADKSRVRASGGAGLGLALSRELARATSGDIILHEKNSPGALFEWRIKKKLPAEAAHTKDVQQHFLTEPSGGLAALPSDVSS